jgi:nucleoside-diphosphate-sugar epimerase
MSKAGQMRCLVTGATGHLGAALTRLLVSEGYPTAVLVRPSSNLWRLASVRSSLHRIEGELSDLASAGKSFRQFAPDAIFHLAWGGVSRELRDSPDQIRVNLTGGLRIVDLACDLRCRVFVGLGSQAEYGGTDEPLTEDTPVRPNTAYGLAKLCLGQLALKQCELRGVRAVWLRLLATYGPRDNEGMLIPYVIGCLLRGESPVLTAGNQQWDYLYVEDAAEALLAAALDESLAGTFNLAHGAETWTIRQIATFLRDQLAPGVPLRWNARQSRSLLGSSERFSALTGWRPRTGMEEGLLRTADWYKEQITAGEASVP